MDWPIEHIERDIIELIEMTVTLYTCYIVMQLLIRVFVHTCIWP